ncbi:MAG TPA: alpha/beta family hydrolase [Longimicrobiales bacterium]|nr:alpha/beta family hydrolase [Longimicrobiales bacterium]
MTATRDLTVPTPSDPVSGILLRPDDTFALLVLAHGAGAGMRHPFMETIARALAERGVATLRYQFPYMEAGKKRPDRAHIAQAVVLAAVDAARAQAPELPLFAGGKSFGGRMTSQAASEGALPDVAGLVFLGFPLHAAGREGTERAAHLADVDVPMLFLQGTRDRLAKPELLEPVLRDLGDRATLHVVDGGDHSFKVLKRSGRSEGEVMDEIADAAADWMRGVAGA